MRLVISMMTTRKLEEQEIEKASNVLSSAFLGKECEVHEYRYRNDRFFETDMDVLDVDFSKENIFHELQKVIELCINIMEELKIDIDFIIANDDTGTETERYQKDWNDIEKAGLFITSREIPDIEKYSSIGKYSAYVNFEYVSFGCMF